MKERSVKNFRKKYFFGGVAAGLLAVALLYFIYMLLPAVSPASHPDTIQTIRKAKSIQRTIEKNYYGKIDEKQQTDMMFAGQVAGLGDPYSRYFTKEAYEQELQKMRGEYTGIGISFSQDADDLSILVQKVEVNSPAEQAGLRAGDKILSIEGQSVTTLNTSEVTELIHDHLDRELTFVVKRKGEPGTMFIRVTPREIEIATVSERMLSDQIGYLAINRFSKVTVEQFDTAMNALKSQGMQKLIIDLRNNPGGLVDSAEKILKKILPKGIVFYEEDKHGKRSYHEDTDDEQLQMPLVVLVNGNSASSAEIFTGAVKDYGIGTIIGEKTFGKGIVQDIYTLSDGSVLKLTSTYYFTPDGHNIHGVGIDPDVPVAKGEAADADEQLNAAVARLQ